MALVPTGTDTDTDTLRQTHRYKDTLRPSHKTYSDRQTQRDIVRLTKVSNIARNGTGTRRDRYRQRHTQTGTQIKRHTQTFTQIPVSYTHLTLPTNREV